ncbi:CLUMA_CG007592, isoform A [Clunio marinus]|uniref:CLUMA_CG007592, isoform A n=1 Tax=Clunio marinus TaxID=568069 RepID=A0A1J1I1B3_9DIPT|nr:CLUMA_CG007592, isoform A [Clunio marinus]
MKPTYFGPNLTDALILLPKHKHTIMCILRRRFAVIFFTVVKDDVVTTRAEMFLELGHQR